MHGNEGQMCMGIKDRYTCERWTDVHGNYEYCVHGNYGKYVLGN